MTKKFKIVAIGESMVEMRRERDHWQLGFAGDTLNSAYYLEERLGDQAQVEYCTCVGDDLYSTQMLEFIEKNGIGTRYIRRLTGKRPGLYLIHQQAGDRQFTYWRETSAARHLADDEDFLRQAVAGADVVYFSGITLAILDRTKRAIFLDIIAQATAGWICFDPNIRPALWHDNHEMKQALAQAGALCHIVLPTYEDEAALMGDTSPYAMARRYQGYGAGEVVVKNGAAPALAVNQQASAECAALAVSDIVDATGAGDSFNAAYLATRLQGGDLAASLKAGHEMAAAVIRASGALIDKNTIK